MYFIELNYSNKTLLLDLEKVVSIEQKYPEEVTEKDGTIVYKASILLSFSSGISEITINDTDKSQVIDDSNQIYLKLYNAIQKKQKIIEKIL